ncbi:glycosyltransferase family 8 protein [Murimonas intestini]|uniref:Lipopolysaccharide biosynthesis glycosyltransferase n=1 Tax=Murimonas intestini TaxID=1337051 RepID=A0AB73T8Z6_9FIRM|nr:glycosyltransferase family 8 protein [Murimonas intestini]MCR1839489.1 glycosyltransferase family 8 protein [Murimonas intestini]MCR1867968.1 glycosyltransferase family 8 protein [Murimonas intestini]MCR1882394.1 glycosyltransferase family 8 protein [Murimonas intestini]
MEKKKLYVLYQADDNYAVFMGVSILSLFINNQDLDINIYILDAGISKANKIKIVSMAKRYHQKIFFKSMILLMKKLQGLAITKYTGFRKNKVSFYKLFLEYILPQEIDNILYIDCDTIVQGNLYDLTEIDMADSPVGMVQDALATKAFKKSIGFSNEDKYFNSGVILFNIQQWIDKKCLERIVKHAQEGHVYGTVDQDYLNVVLKNEIFSLKIEYNLQSPYFIYNYNFFEKIFVHNHDYYSLNEIDSGIVNPKIIHFLRFCGESPWHKDNLHPCTIYFDEYLKESSWKEYQKKQSANDGLIFKIEKLMYQIFPRNLFCIIFRIVHDNMLNKSRKKTH